MIFESSDLTELHWFNIPDTPTKSSTLNNEFILFLKRLTGLDDGTPMFIYMWNNFITDLKLISHNVDTSDLLNQKGLHIFLYEPFCAHEPNLPHNQQFYSDLPHRPTQEYNVDELDSIKEYVIRNKLTNVVVHTCDYNVERYYTNYSAWMTLICDDLFLKNYTVFNTITDTIHYNFTKKFLCLNWRYTKHRHLVAAYLLDKSSHLSWYFNVEYKELKKNIWFNIDRWIVPKLLINVNLLNDVSPLCLDITHTTSTKIHDGSLTDWPQHDYKTPALTNSTSNALEKFYRDSFCEIVNETRFAQPTGNFSEKVYQAIRHKKPFVLVAPPMTLEYIKSQGFKTFDKFWDESYDLELVHETRLSMIFEIIDFIDNKPLNELKLIYKEMEDILEHNFNVLVQKTPFKTIQKL